MAYANPFMATEVRGRLGAKLAELAPGDIDVFFFTNGGADANENAIKIARAYTGRHKILARYRSYHGGTHGAMALTGDPQALELRARHAGRRARPRPVSRHGARLGHRGGSAGHARGNHPARGAADHRGVLSRDGERHQWRPDPARRLSAGRARVVLTTHGILMVCDEVMAGFGRTGEWFAVNHWNVVPDIITMAKGLTSAYVAMGAVGDAAADCRSLPRQGVPGWPDLQQSSARVRRSAGHASRLRRGRHDWQCPAAGPGHGGAARGSRARSTHASAFIARSASLASSSSSRTRRRRSRSLPFGQTSAATRRLGALFREEGLYTFVRWHTFFTNPPLCVTEGAAERRLRDDRSRADAAGGGTPVARNFSCAPRALQLSRATEVARYFFSFIGIGPEIDRLA